MARAHEFARRRAGCFAADGVVWLCGKLRPMVKRSFAS
jgi:hypothetical protein